MEDGQVFTCDVHIPKQLLQSWLNSKYDQLFTTLCFQTVLEQGLQEARACIYRIVVVESTAYFTVCSKTP